jgi:hypothetical protein
MKWIGIILFLFVAVSAESDSEKDSESSSDCETWPKSLKTVRDCCNFPNFFDNKIDSECNIKCLTNLTDPECTTKCYVNKTNLIIDTKINVEAVKKIYYQSATIVWKDVLEKAIEKCEFELESEMLSKSLITYYNCINEMLAKDCKGFLQSPDCLSTEEHFQTCKNVSFDCSKWSLPDPTFCCKVPQLVTLHSCDKCKVNCGKFNFLPTQQQKCFVACSTGMDGTLVKNGTIDFELVKKVLKENKNNSEIWEKAIESAVEKCKNLNGLKNLISFNKNSKNKFSNFRNSEPTRCKHPFKSQSLPHSTLGRQLR